MLKLILALWIINKLGIFAAIIASLVLWICIIAAALIIAYVQSR